MKLALLFMLFAGQAFAAGGVVNNGGDSVKCAASSMGPAGMYTLDYALAIGRGAATDDFVMIANWSHSRQRLLRLLARVDQGLARSFHDFSQSLEQREQPIARKSDFYSDWNRQWIVHRGRPLEVDDIGDISRLPMACKYLYRSSTVAKFKIYRLIQREADLAARRLIYRYDQTRLRGLRLPLQHSFLMVHEWLWDWTQDIEVNRRVNAFLHSTEIDYMTPRQIARRLKALGL